MCIIVFPSASFAETDVTNKILLNKGRLLYDRLTKQSYFDVSVTNISSDVLLAPINVVIDSVSPSTVTVANADGVTADGKPYFEYKTDSEQLLFNATTIAKKWAFNNPTALRFVYTVKIMAALPMASSVIGVDGGILIASTTDGLDVRLDVPPGAVVEDGATFTVVPADQLPNAQGAANADLPITPPLQFGPAGLDFIKPVTVTIEISPGKLSEYGFSSLEEALPYIRVFTRRQGESLYELVVITDVDLGANTLTAEMNHFSLLEIDVVTFSVESLEMHSSVVKGQKMSFQPHIKVNNSLRNLLGDKIALNAVLVNTDNGIELISEEEATTTILPGSGTEEWSPIYTNVAAPDFETKDTRLLLVNKENGKVLWSQQIIVDFPTPDFVSDFQANDVNNLIDKYRPTLFFNHERPEDEVYRPTKIDVIFGGAESKLLNNTAIGSENTVVNNPGAEDLARHPNSNYAFYYDGTADTYKNREHNVYATAFEDGDIIYLTYIFFYVHDPKSPAWEPIPTSVLSPHDNDNERIVVILKRNATGGYDPTHVVYGHHLGNQRFQYLDNGNWEGSVAEWGSGYVVVPWDNVLKEGPAGSTNPNVYIAEGSHGCYPRPGRYRLNELGVWWEEEAGVNGEVWLPDDVHYTITALPRLDVIDADHKDNFLLFPGSVGVGGGAVGTIGFGTYQLTPYAGWWLLYDREEFTDESMDHIRLFPDMPTFADKAPQLLAPADTSLVPAGMVTLYWKPLGTDVGDFDEEYCLVVNEDGSPEDIPQYNGCDADQFISDTSMAVALPMTPGKTYWWSVWARSKTFGVWSRPSGWFSFTTSDAPDIDNDLDGYTENQGDKDDSNPDIYPGAEEICYDAIDQDCDGFDAPCKPVITRSQQGVSAVFTVIPDLPKSDANTLQMKLNLLSAEGCWYEATPNFDDPGYISNAEVYLVAPWETKEISTSLTMDVDQHYRLDLSMNTSTTNTLVALDVIMRGLFGRRLGDVMQFNQSAIGQVIDIVKGSGMVSSLDVGVAYLVNGEELKALNSFFTAFQQITNATVGAETMNNLFVSVLGDAASGFWEQGIGIVLQSLSLPGRYFLLKEILDSYAINRCSDPIDGFGYVRLDVESECSACSLTLWYKDADDDGYSDGVTLLQDERPLGFKTSLELNGQVEGDVDDTNSFIYPSAPEICGDGIDQDGDGSDLICPPDILDTPSIISFSYDPSILWNYITWTDTGAPFYHVYWGTESGVTKGSESMPLTSTLDYGHTGVLPGWTYYYRVASVAADGVTESELSAEVSIYVPTQCQTPTVTSAGQVWMDRNLGASRVAMSYDDEEAYGDLYQWGRGTDGHEKRNSPITTINSSTDDPGHGSFITEDSYPYDWRVPQNDNLWQGESGINNPCPAGFRLPTYTELETERLSWASNNSAGAFASPLKLVAASCRGGDGTVYIAGCGGRYWSSTVDGVYSRNLIFDSDYAYMYSNHHRAYGFSARCISDETPDVLPPQNVNVVFDPVEDWNYITWDDVPGATEYHVYWGTETGVTESSESLDPPVTSPYGHTGVLPGSTYCYVVTAEVNGVESALSEEVCVTIPEEDQTFDTVISETGQVWMDRNLGASQVATSSTDSAAYGDLYQWGRGSDGHEKRNSPITSVNSSTDDPGHGNFITESSYPYDWRVPQNNNLWQGESGINNPCPAGFRLPTYTELETERLSWAINNSAGAFASPLKLVFAGYRYNDDGTVVGAGSVGLYWSGTVDGIYSRYLGFFSYYAFMSYSHRAFGFSARCLED